MMLNDDLISAYLDGELDAERRVMVERHLQSDRGAAARLERMRSSDMLLKAAFPADQVLQDDLLATKILSGSEQPRPRRQWATRMAALAAAVALGLALGQFVPSGRNVTSNYALSPQEVSFLDTRLSGQSAETEAGLLQMTLSVHGENGALCREYRVTNEVQSADVLACRDDADGWRMVAAAAASRADGYVPAGSSSPLDAAIANLGGSEALDENQERALIERGWR